MSATGSYGDWNAVLWLLIIVLAWLSVSVVLGCWIGKALKRHRQQTTVPVREQHRDAA